MSVKKQFKFKDKVRIRDEFVELKLGHGGSMFILAIDERGLPHFPERMKRKLPSYVTELAQQTIHHKLWCAQVEGLGMCNCADPTVNMRLWTASEDKHLACDMCSIKSSMEQIAWLDPIGKPLRLRWTNDGERLYWVVGPHAAGSILCGECLREFLKGRVFSDERAASQVLPHEIRIDETKIQSLSQLSDQIAIGCVEETRDNCLMHSTHQRKTISQTNTTLGIKFRKFWLRRAGSLQCGHA